MKLVRCDVCKKTFRDGETNRVTYEDGTKGSVLVEDGEGGYFEAGKISLDICRECSINLLNTIAPWKKCLPFDKYTK